MVYRRERLMCIRDRTKTAAHIYQGTGSSNGYKLDGVEGPFIEFKAGNTYRFDQADSSNSGHPLRFYYDPAKTTIFSTGVTTNGTPGSSGAYTQIVVADTTPHILYYQCSSVCYLKSWRKLKRNSHHLPTSSLSSMLNYHVHVHFTFAYIPKLLKG